MKCVNVKRNRIKYLITPKGIAAKGRLTYEFMEYSFRVFHEGRRHLKTMLAEHTSGSPKRMAIYGTGEAAEFAYLCLRELGVEPVAIFDRDSVGSFLGVPLVDVRDHESVRYDLIVVATSGSQCDAISWLTGLGIARSKLLSLQPMPPAVGSLSRNRRVPSLAGGE